MQIFLNCNFAMQTFSYRMEIKKGEALLPRMCQAFQRDRAFWRGGANVIFCIFEATALDPQEARSPGLRRFI